MQTISEKQTPIYDSLSIVEIQVADRIQRLRREKGFTLANLAKRCGLSVSYLSRVENHKAGVLLAKLENIAKAFAVPMTMFFDNHDTTKPLCICHRGEGRKTLLHGSNGYSFELLAHMKTGKLLEPLIVEVSSSVKQMPLSQHPGEEFNYLLEGECHFLYGNEQIHLSVGDSVYYDATIPHAVRAIKNEHCRILAIVASRDYLFHGDLEKLLRGDLS